MAVSLSPRYLNSSTYLRGVSPQSRVPVQFTNIAFVFTVLITRLLSVQKRWKQVRSAYNWATPPAISATSSAKASINNYRLARV
jgi:hypothetical protein